MSKFEIGDRVEYTPTTEDSAYVDSGEEFRGEHGTVVEVDSLAAGVVGVKWDNEAFATSYGDPYVEGMFGRDDPSDRSAFTANLTKIEEGN